MTAPGTVRPPQYGDADQPDPEPFVSWVVRNPAKVLITIVAAALAFWANLALGDSFDEPRLQSYPRTALLRIETDDKVCWTASTITGRAGDGCGNGTVTLRRTPGWDREVGEPAFLASVVKKKQTDVRHITASLVIDGDVIDRVKTKNYTLYVTTPD